MKCKIILLFCSFALYINAQTNIIINEENGHFDTQKKLLLIQTSVEFLATTNGVPYRLILENDTFSLDIGTDTLFTSKSYEVHQDTSIISLFFTKLPVITINSSTEIVDEPKCLADLTYNNLDTIIKSNCGIEIRGGFTQSYPKKTYDIELWKDNEGVETNKIVFSGMREDDDWVLDALYNEPLRIRSYVANKLWLKIHTPHYINEAPNAKAGAENEYVELFLNGKYNGVYTLMEQVDRKQLQIIKTEQGTIRGELFKGVAWGATTYGDVPFYDNDTTYWGGYTAKYPDSIEWKDLHGFKDFVINSNPEDFKNEFFDQFSLENAVDYFLFINLLRATDNTGKNIYLSRYDISYPYFNIPWDLDGCFGNVWHGGQMDVVDDILTNGMYERLLVLKPLDFHKKLEERWTELRASSFRLDSLCQDFIDASLLLESNRIYEKEQLVWDYFYQIEKFDYLKNWLSRRLTFLDNYFDKISKISIVINDEVTILANPVKDKIVVKGRKDFHGKSFMIQDLRGRQVLDRTEIYSSAPINVSNLTSGIYFFIIEGYKPIKFIKI